MYKAVFNGKEITVETKVSLFSPNEADRGTLSMLRHVGFVPGMKLLDLGCGAGIVSLAACCFGLLPQDIVMTDIDPVASSVSLENMERNGFGGVLVLTGDALSEVPGNDYDLILSNPPYHTDFKVAKTFIEKGFNRLKIGGKIYMVTKRKDWYKNKLISVFGGVKIYEDDGYFVFEAEKRNMSYASKKRPKV